MYKILIPIVLFFTLLGSCISLPVKTVVSDSQEIVLLLQIVDSISKEPLGHCSGFSVAPAIVVTAGHCLKDGTILLVTDNKGNTFSDVSILLDDDNKDVGIIRVDNLILDFYGQLRPSKDLSLGERLTSLGFPGFAKGFWFEVGYLHGHVEHYIVAEGISYPGLSGGPVLDERGFVVGLVSAYSPFLEMMGNGIHHYHKEISWLVNSETIIQHLLSLK